MAIPVSIGMRKLLTVSGIGLIASSLQAPRWVVFAGVALDMTVIGVGMTASFNWACMANPLSGHIYLLSRQSNLKTNIVTAIGTKRAVRRHGQFQPNTDYPPRFSYPSPC